MKILIIGAGPIGCYTGRLLKQNNVDVRIIEEHPAIGKPVHCAGLVSKEVISEIKVPLDGRVIVNKIDGAEFYFKSEKFTIERKGVAVIIDREKFDCCLGSGLEINLDTRFMGIEKEGSGYLVETDKGEFYADIVIGADGANSALRKVAGFKEDIEYLRGVQFRVAVNNVNVNIVKVYLKHPFFAWVIPESTRIARVGIISHNPYQDLINFLKEESIQGEILEKFAGIVPLGSCQSQKENLFLVGDAACQVKPLTHGGVYYGMRCAEILTDCILSNQADDYERRWKERFQREISIGARIKRFYEKLSLEDARRIFEILKDEADSIAKFGDFENHSKVFSLIVKNPRLQIILGKVLISILRESYIF